MISPDAEDWQLLDEYATQNSEGAFRVLVERHAGMVYHAALRQLGNEGQAEEVTQAVFIALAEKGGRLSRRVLIGGWLYRATRYAVLNLARAERTRRRHEQEIAMETAVASNEDAQSLWDRISPFLDQALGELSAADREAILVRYFEGKSHKETSASLGISEDAAKKRLSRALERLRGILARRGTVTPALALPAAFALHAVRMVPEGMAAAAAEAALGIGPSLASSPAIAAVVQRQMARARGRATAAATAVVLALLFLFWATRAKHEAAPPAGKAVVVSTPVRSVNAPPTVAVEPAAATTPLTQNKSPAATAPPAPQKNVLHSPRFDLTPQQVEAHAAAVEKWRATPGNGRGN